MQWVVMITIFLISLLIDYIKNIDVLVEFCISEGWNKFKSGLKDFDLFCSPFALGYNQICIGIRREINYRLLSITSIDVCNITLPEFLQVDIEIKHKIISIIGVRIKTEKNTQFQQYDYLNMYLKTVESFICLGDFNGVNKTLSKFFSNAKIYGPRILNGYHSFVHKNGDRCGLDWLISKDVKDVYNRYPDRKESPYATYDWSFLN